ncbi:hypothetical protein ACFOGI_12820 [Virgibacillus xinjiangensis]|uniref:YfhD-like protein n=1 Tax=Virgibacillus xinjiangensis TaxID=393090 RepID=A0ABV7CXU1_9BACI
MTQGNNKQSATLMNNEALRGKPQLDIDRVIDKKLPGGAEYRKERNRDK